MLHRSFLAMAIVVAVLLAQFAPASAQDGATGQSPADQPAGLTSMSPTDDMTIAGADISTPADMAPLRQHLLDTASAAVDNYWAAPKDFAVDTPHPRLLGLEFDGSTIVLNFDQAMAQLVEPMGTDLLEAIDIQLMSILAPAELSVMPNFEYRVLVEGAPIYPEVAQLPETAAIGPAAIGGKKIVISPGHGRCDASVAVSPSMSGCDLGKNNWPFQRGVQLNSLREDLVNQELVRVLDTKLRDVGAATYPTREMNKSAGNHASGYPWWEMDASEYVKRLGVPESVWKPFGSNGTRRDINARPAYGNHVGADAMISIHNNGGGGTACNGHGTETLYDTNNGYQVQSKRLATLIQQKIIERVRRDWNNGWCDRGAKGFNGSYGENRMFKGPAVIVELGFMDVQSDSDALNNATFRTMAMEAIRDAVVEYFGGAGAGVIDVDRAWTNDGGTEWSTSKTSFAKGAPIRYIGAVNNKTGSTAPVLLTFEATGPGGRIAYYSGTVNTAVGVQWWGLESAIPSNALPGAYTFKITATQNNRSSSKSSTFVVEGGVTCTGKYKAEYFANRTLSGSPTYTTCEGWPISHDWQGGGPGNGIPTDNFSARWTGQASISSGRYTFIAVADDGIRVWLDGTQIIDGWRDQPATEYRHTRDVSGGAHSIKVEYYENGGGALARFRWEAASAGSGNLAKGRPANAWSQESSGYPPGNATDGSMGTRWSSRISTSLGTQWWWVDLGGKTYDRVVIRWENAYATKYYVGWSDDCSNYWGYEYTASSSTAYSHVLGSHGSRCVGIRMDTRAPRMNNYSIWEVEVYNGAAALGSEDGSTEAVLELTPIGDLQQTRIGNEDTAFGVYLPVMTR